MNESSDVRPAGGTVIAALEPGLEASAVVKVITGRFRVQLRIVLLLTLPLQVVAILRLCNQGPVAYLAHADRAVHILHFGWALAIVFAIGHPQLITIIASSVV